MVIGPTPPGTGVIAPATSAALANSTSPSSRVLPPSPSRRFMPTSITVAPGFSQSPLISSGDADGGDEDVGAADHFGQVAGAAVGHGHRAILPEEELRHRLADDVGAADHHRLEARKVAEPVLQEHQAAERRAGDEAALADREPAGVDDVEAVDVLGRVDRVDHRLVVEALGERELDEDSVDPVVAVQLLDEVEQLAWVASAGRRCSKLSKPASRVALPLLVT
jgi:hypothetical protein